MDLAVKDLLFGLKGIPKRHAASDWCTDEERKEKKRKKKKEK
jgi:hypothetical protein